jgi:hypothetical protein
MGVFWRRLSAAGLAGVPAAALPLPHFNQFITKNEIQLPMPGHQRRHVGEKSAVKGHAFISLSAPYLN